MTVFIELKRGYVGCSPTFDREQVLDVSEDVLLQVGAGALTTDAFAKAMGISKGNDRALDARVRHPAHSSYRPEPGG